ncbi:MAG: hypothetical protein RPS47_13835 [Colwellia sp.]|jgi:hypothetical protein
MDIHEKITRNLIDDKGNKCKVGIDEKTGEMKIFKPRFKAFTEDVYPCVTELSRVNPQAAAIFLFFVEHMGNQNALIVSYAAMEEHFKKGRKAIYNSINYLKEKQFIDILKSGNMNIYCINARIVWNQSQDKIHFAKFNAVVYVNAHEQISKNKINNSKIIFNKPNNNKQ